MIRWNRQLYCERDQMHRNKNDLYCTFIMRFSIPICLCMPFPTQDNELITMACSKHWSEDMVWNMLGTCVFTRLAHHGQLVWLPSMDYGCTWLTTCTLTECSECTHPPCHLHAAVHYVINQKNKFSFYANGASKYKYSCFSVSLCTSVFLQKAS